MGHGPQALYGTLLCAPQLDVWPNSTGPWEGGNWISLPCPAEEKPIDGGAGYWIGSRHSTSSFSQAGGGFGHHNNGYWHYRFHNHYRFTLSVQFWAVCVSRRATTV